MNDTYFLNETLKLARKGLNWTFPNPLVGALIVKNGRIIAKGYHHKAGAPHAEVDAIKTSGGHIQGSTLYVNLEPCTHHGRTPPCVDTITKAGIRRVVCATLDPNPKVHGRGIAKLKKAGIEVSVGLLKEEAKALNEAFFTFYEKRRPFIAIKFAASLDGKIATRTGDSKWITNEEARMFARRLRGQYQAVLVGINTVLKDNPHLGVRERGKRDPLRIILDSKLRIPLTSLALRDNNVLITTTSRADERKIKALRRKGITVITFDTINIPLRSLLEELRKREIASVLVEGGGTTLGSFVDEQLVDKVYVAYAPMLIGGEEAVSAVRGKGAKTLNGALRLRNSTFRRFGDNLLTISYM